MLAADGAMVRLETLRVGRRLITSRQAVERFLTRLAQEDTTPPLAAPPTGRAAERARQAEAARLRELGI
jgi:hypothetical protein